MVEAVKAHRPPLRLLLVEDSENDAAIVLGELEKAGFAPRWERVDSEQALKRALENQEWDLIISDYSLPGFSGLAALRTARAIDGDVPFILVSGTIGEDLAVVAMKAGAHDYLLKDNLSRLAPAVTRELQEHEQRKSLKKIQGELEKNQELLRQSQKLEAVGRLAGGIAHDFNNLLTIIIGYVDLTLEGMESSHPLRTNLEHVNASVTTAAALTHQLMAFSGGQVMTPQALDLNAVAGEMFKMLRPLIREDIQFTIQPATVAARVKADPGHIQQVIMNLVLNARDAMPRGGKLVLRTSQAELQDPFPGFHAQFKPGHYAMISVSDTGIGMDEKTLERIFEPFFTTKETGKGTGLGLATVFGIVSQSGGQIEVTSRPGEGATFNVYLPALTEEETETPRPVGSKSELVRMAKGQGTILVVENDNDIRRLVGYLLERSGYKVLSAANAEEAMNAARADVDLLLTDMIMPGINGLELARRLELEHPGMKTVYMSGYAAGDVAEELMSTSGFEFLQKPFRSEQLLRKIHDVLAAAE